MTRPRLLLVAGCTEVGWRRRRARLGSALLVGLALSGVARADEPIRLRIAFEDTHNFPYHLGDGHEVEPEMPRY